VWRIIRDETEPALIETANRIVARLIGPITASIITDFSNPSELQSLFFEELHLQQFPRAERVFVETFAETQMFRWRVKQECMMRSDRLRIDP
jgi:hypothetical protein